MMDTLGTLLVAWMIFVTLILILGTFFYFKFIHHLENEAGDTSDNTPGADGKNGSKKTSATGGSSTGVKWEDKARRPTIVPQGKCPPVSLPVATGADPDAVKWTNNVFTWLYNSAEGGAVIKKLWLETVNENTVKTAIETGILVEVVELMKETPPPLLTNMVVDCSPTDNMTITCDCEATLYLRIITTRTQKDKTTESEYACAVTPLHGRLNIAVVTAELLAVVKFDGWPEDVEVSLTLEGIRNNATGRDEQQMLDVINEVITSALRNSVLDINFQPNQTFPRFRRARQVPDPIIPVGYDSMVREKQTHPPSVLRKAPPKAEFVPLHNEKIEPAGESFTALNLTSKLTSSEEQLIARNLNKYPSLENAEMEPGEMEELCKTWQENYVPAADVPYENSVEEELTQSTTNTTTTTATAISDHKDEEKTQEFVLMVSNRSKLIDEPRNSLPIVDDMNGMEEEEEDEGELMEVRPRPRDEPCLRKEIGSPLVLSTPKQESFSDKEEDDFEDARIRFDKLEIMDNKASVGPLQNKGSFNPSSHSTTGQPMGIPGLNGKRLLVKIVKAMGIGCDKPVSEVYSVVEMDEPPQKFTTSVVKDTTSPFWDEQFLFDLSGGTLELLFELYDKSKGNFLGLGIVGIEELVATPSQRQIIPLQPRPYESDEVSGSLTVEFLFLDRADLPEHTLRASNTSQSVTPRGNLITTTTTTYIKAPEAQDIIVNGGDGVAAAVIRDIEEKSVVTNNASKSTMIIHASKKPEMERGYMSDDHFYQTTPLSTTTTTTTGTPTITTTITTTMPSTTTAASTTPTTTTTTTETTENEERGRSRGVRRKRDSFFGTLKKRFSRSKVRSKSMDPGQRDTSLERDPSVGRSISMERSSTLNRASGLLSVPSSGGGGGDAGSTRSSLSDASAISGSSTRTYINEASTLIIETSENGVFKHYLIPLSLQTKSKWRKKGLKLHIFGEHTFVAKHMSSSIQCEVCQKTLGRRFGKQGYVCRDCGYKCHKPCHVKTEVTCPNSTVNNMDLEYVRDPKEERRAWMKKTKPT